MGKPVRCRILALQIDNAGELLSEEFTAYLNEHRIKRRLSVPYQHQQNGKAERCIQTLEGRILAMLNGAGASLNLWGEAALCAGYLWQYTPSSTLPCGVTPFELASKSKPDLSHLRVWGSRCFARIAIERQTKLGPRSRECVFMGYPEGVKGYARHQHGCILQLS
jgi:hypothetical protein